MNPRTVWRVLRVEGLIPFTGSALLIGFVVTLWETGIAAADWSLFAIAAAASFLVHIDAHIWNDVMDLEIDRREKSRETGRDRPLVFGWATVADYRRLSAVVTTVVILLAAYLTLFRAWMPLLIVLGFVFDYGYNHPRIALAHGPHTEWYIFPWLVVGVTVTLVYAGTGLLSLLAFILSVLHGLTVSCFVVSMMRRDSNSDRLGGKNTSSVLSPEVPHSTIYGIVTMVASVLMVYPLALVLGDAALAYALCCATALIAGVNTAIGARIDQLCTRALYSALPDFEARAHRLTLQQVGASLVHVSAICIILAAFGVAS
jgi:1,4-dihydroxy-2-naphthoate octaprenyltransferase